MNLEKLGKQLFGCSAKRGKMSVRAGNARDAFSLVEVTMAVGIVAFALVAIIGVFGSTVTRANDNLERRTMLEAVDTLRGYLITQGFSNAYTMAKSNSVLLYVSYRADENGAPSPSAPEHNTLGTWLKPDDSNLANYEAARVGRWVKARLQVSPSNPAGTNLPTNPDDYPAGVLAVLARIDAVPATNAPLANPRLNITIGVTR